MLKIFHFSLDNIFLHCRFLALFLPTEKEKRAKETDKKENTLNKLKVFVLSKSHYQDNSCFQCVP